MQLPVVRQEDDLGTELLLSRGREHVAHLHAKALPVLLSALVAQCRERSSYSLIRRDGPHQGVILYQKDGGAHLVASSSAAGA
jgi:hypothetical protein